MSRRNSALASERAPPASLTGITIRTRSSAGRKAGDLTNRLFEEAETHLPPPPPAPVLDAKRAGAPLVAKATPVVEPEPIPEPEVAAEPPATVELEAPVEAVAFAEPEAFSSPETFVEPETYAEPEAFAEPAPEPVTEPEPYVAAEPIPAPTLSWAQPEPEAEEPPPEPVRAPVVERVEMAAAAELPEPPAGPSIPDLKDLPGYWRFLRGGAEFPTSEALDRDVVAARWPGSLLIAFMRNAQDPRSEPSLARVTRLGVTNADTENAVDYAPYATEWMLDLGRAALSACEPIEELQRLPTRAGASGFRLIALPLGPLNGDPDSVLCQLMPDTAAPRFGKKRNWLED